MIRDHLLCCIRAHMDLRRDRKRTLKVREMDGAQEYLAVQEADVGKDVESPKRCVERQQRLIVCLVGLKRNAML